MAKQKTSRKAFATTAAAVMAATAVTPVAAFAASTTSFPDVPAGEYAEAINNLAGQGILNGFDDGTFKPNDPVLREQAAKILATALKLDTTGTENYPDVSPDNWSYKYIVAVTKAGIFGGDENGNFKPFDNLTRQEAAKIIVEAFGFKGSSELTFGDKANIQSWAVPYVKTAVANGILKGDDQGNFNPNANIKRGDFALMIQRALNAVAAPQVESVSAITSKSLKVKFNKVVDTTKAKFEVKKGSVKVNTETITFNADKTEAVIELTGKLTAGEYTVNVTGLTDQALTATTTVENERVETVKILSENAVLDKNGENVTVGYKVENQYGEDITARTALTANAAGTVVGGNANPSKGVVTIPVKEGVKEGDSIVLTLVHAATGKSASATVKVSAKAQVSEIAITGLYNKDGKALTETTDLSKDAFYLLVEGKDQYGNVVDEAALDASNAVLINNTNPLIAKVATDFETIKVNGKDVTALKLNGPVTAGETTVMLISTASGKNATFKVKVAESQRTDTVTFEVPDLVVANEKLFVPIQVLDKEGNLVTDEKVLNDATRGIKVSGVTDAKVKKVDGKIGVEVPDVNVKEGYISLVAVSSTGKSTIANIQVKAEAKPVRVEGVTSDIKTTVLTGSSAQTLSEDNVKIIDQYEREMSAAQKANYFTGNTAKYSLVITDEKPNTGEGAVNINGKEIVPIAKGTEKVTISIKDEVKDEVLTGSEKSVTFRVTDGTEYKSYEVKPVGTVYDEVAAGKSDTNAYDKAVEVYGVLDDGSKVKLKHGVDYTVSSTNATFNNDVVDGTIDVDAAYTTYGDAKEIKLPLTVTINATGEKLTQEVTISKETPKVTKLEVVANGKAADLAAGKTVAALENVSYDAAKVDAPFDFSVLAGDVADIVVTDQYGVQVELTGTDDKFADGTTFVSTLTFNKVDGELVFVNNGTASAKVTEIPKDSVFNVVVSAGTLTAAPVKVTATSDYSYSSAQAAAQKVVDDEAAKYESTVIILKSINAAADITAEVQKLKTGETKNDGVTVAVKSIKEDKGEYLTLTDGVLKLAKQAANNANDNTAVIVLSFTKDGKEATKEVTVTIEPQDA
ncbi:S-layer homology domain-containing protein [Caldibacillus thermoamylovorans]|uniref:S-layer homology domain-containing protein n=1 Tax=Caldibacillus thermoamylovorans TaxID=35841 RepID=UPI00203F0D99|nr:S-layer homology domain-containing protein [Caldibacillus thermoamylovorans]MCM3797731.1 S-layer homology domain-containing protein [Caldibacillus thermoamylovorans]